MNAGQDVIVTQTPLAKYADRIVTSTVLGGIYGIALWFVDAGIVMPYWIGTVGVAALSVPYLDSQSLGGYVIYSLLAGGSYPLLVRTPL